jgi:hypothetical protein
VTVIAHASPHHEVNTMTEAPLDPVAIQEKLESVLYPFAAVAPVIRFYIEEVLPREEDLVFPILGTRLDPDGPSSARLQLADFTAADRVLRELPRLFEGLATPTVPTVEDCIQAVRSCMPHGKTDPVWTAALDAVVEKLSGLGRDVQPA